MQVFIIPRGEVVEECRLFEASLHLSVVGKCGGGMRLSI